jgi:hypothetical protein
VRLSTYFNISLTLFGAALMVLDPAAIVGAGPSKPALLAIRELINSASTWLLLLFEWLQ